MSTHYHMCVWIDHQQAKVFGIGRDGDDEMVVHEAGPLRHIHRKADHVGHGKVAPDDLFLGEIAFAITGAGAILIVGPGTAKDEFAHYLRQHHPALASRLWAIEPMDHPTDREIAAVARRFFRAGDRMHG